MKEEILKLRKEGKSYSEIQEILGCSKSTISYYCSDGQKLKVYERAKKRRSDKLLKKIESYKNRNYSLKFRDFQRRNGDNQLMAKQENNFTIKEAKEKIGNNPICYLTGEKINLSDTSSYHLDHIIPVNKGGKNTLDNLGILKAEINKMKSDLTVDELIDNCKKILIFAGYTVGYPSW